MGWISSAISSIGSFISNAISSVAPEICSFAKSAVSVVAKLPIPGIEPIKLLPLAANIIHAVVHFLGVDSENDPQILGAKAEQSDKSMDDFGNDVEAYIKYLKNEVELDKEKLHEMTPEEKYGCTAIGMSLETKAVEQKIGGIIIPPECIGTLVKIQSAGIKIDAERLVEIVQSVKQAGITNMNDIVEYLEGKGDSDRLKTGEALTTAMGENAIENILNLKEAVRKYEED